MIILYVYLESKDFYLKHFNKFKNQDICYIIHFNSMNNIFIIKHLDLYQSFKQKLRQDKSMYIYIYLICEIYLN